MGACLEHPEFPQPATQGVGLWRYLDAWKFDWLLTNQRLLMPSADRLGDWWEGTTPQGHTAWWEQAISKADSAGQRATLEHNRSFLEKMARAFRPHYYVSCWHRSEHESSTMWTAYTSSPDAVAVKTRYDVLAGLMPDYAYIGNVRYVDYALARQPSMNMFEVIMHKDVFFVAEQETRIVVMPPAMNPEHIANFRDSFYESEADPTFRFFAPPVAVTGLIEAIVLHPDAGEAFADRVADQCRTGGLPAPSASRRSERLGQ